MNIVLLELEKDALWESLNDLPHKHDDLSYTVKGMRANEEIPKSDPFWVMSVLPTGKKVCHSLNNFISKRDNINYSNFGYGEEEMVVIRAYAGDEGIVGGRELSQSWLLEMERFIKISWNSLINNGSVDKYSFKPYRELYLSTPLKRYGYELIFNVITTNWWTDEPEEGAISPYDVDELNINEINDDIYKIRVKI